MEYRIGIHVGVVFTPLLNALFPLLTGQGRCGGRTAQAYPTAASPASVKAGEEQSVLVVGFWCPGVGFSFPLTISPSYDKAKENKKGKEGDADSNRGNGNTHRTLLSVVPLRGLVILKMIYRLSREHASRQPALPYPLGRLAALCE